MRFSIATFVWTKAFGNEQLDLIPKVAELGYDDLEVGFDGFSELDPGRLRDALEAAGLGSVVVAFCLPERDVSSSDRAVRDAGISYVTEAADLAAQIGAGVVAGPLAHPPARARALPVAERTAERERAAESLRQIAEHCGERDVRIGIEQLSRYDSDMFNTAEESLAFLAEVDHPAAGLLLDTFHMQIEERSIGEAIRAVGDKLVHFHAAESHRGEIGTGQVDWPDVFLALRDIDYERCVSVESFKPSGIEEDALVNMWRPWFEDSDAFARSCLSFLSGCR